LDRAGDVDTLTLRSFKAPNLYISRHVMKQHTTVLFYLNIISCRGFGTCTKPRFILDLILNPSIDLLSEGSTFC
jgi:hypothetical protein